MPVRSLYIHVGLPKTGSSAIQRFLVDNRDALLAAGLGLGPYLTLPSGKSAALRRAIADEGLPAVMAALAASPGDSIAISSEQLSSILFEAPAEAEALRDAALPHFRPVVVVFLRRQDYWHESLYAQQVKTSYADTIEAYTEMMLGKYPGDFDFDACLGRLERVFGPDNIRVRLYRDAGPNDVIADFLSALDLDRLDLAGARGVGRQNESPHRRKILFLSRVPKPDPAVQDLAAHMTRIVEKTGAIADDGQRFLLPPALRHRLVAANEAGNRALVARYGLPDDGHFTAAPGPADAGPNEAGWSPPAPITPAERRAVLGEALVAAARLRGHPRYRLRIAGKVAALYSRMR